MFEAIFGIYGCFSHIYSRRLIFDEDFTLDRKSGQVTTNTRVFAASRKRVKLHQYHSMCEKKCSETIFGKFERLRGLRGWRLYAYHSELLQETGQIWGRRPGRRWEVPITLVESEQNRLLRGLKRFSLADFHPNIFTVGASTPRNVSLAEPLRNHT